ncbi:hypothetical protein [Staphylococcus ratti]|uniref:Phage protein n=1 Tax=Staphylococcus ratti TaxID=2892440 RepID=A0ABY3PBL9_9STAP|nr:hypothetical protein [Staphylococcus ratti]UEX89705.1 hypothetical protein LN051_09060 [Staphylococcus ratti]
MKKEDYWRSQCWFMTDENITLKKTIEQLQEERDELIVSEARVIRHNANLQRKLTEVTMLFKDHLHHKKAWSCNPYYEKVENELNAIMEDNE